MKCLLTNWVKYSTPGDSPSPLLIPPSNCHSPVTLVNWEPSEASKVMPHVLSENSGMLPVAEVEVESGEALFPDVEIMSPLLAIVPVAIRSA